VPNNVVEGFDRSTTKELLSFIYIARGSAGEVRSMLLLCDRLGRFAHLRSAISDIKSLAESASRQLRAWADSLQNSEIKGQRHLNRASRSEHDRHNRAMAFERKLEQIRLAGQAGSRPQQSHEEA